MRFLIRHSIDMFSNKCIGGWILHSLKKRTPIHLRFVSGGVTIGELLAKEYRKDLHLKNVHPTGYCGFDFNFPPYVDLCAAKTLDIYLGNEKRPYLKLPTSHLERPAANAMPPVFFMHIPKTAGTSFNIFMGMHVPSETFETHIEKYKEQEYGALAQDNTYLAGHLTIEEVKKYFNLDDYHLYSIIRNPHNHLHSHLNWLKGMAAHHGTKFLQRHNSHVQQLAAKVDKLDFTDLPQVKEFVASLEGFELHFFDNCQTRYFLDYRPRKVSRDDFQNTHANVELFKHIGLTEEYGRFKELISSSYNLPEVSLPSAFNKAMHERLYDPASPVMQEALDPLVQVDLLLYEHIKKRFRHPKP